MGCVEINRDHPNENKQSHHNLYLTETQRQAKEWESAIVEEREAFRDTVIEVIGTAVLELLEAG